MGLGMRFYLFAESGLLRISQRLMEGLAHGKDATPQFAGTRQKVANVLVQVADGKPIKIEKADGSFLTFAVPVIVGQQLKMVGHENLARY
jgi:hypothetical protein